MPSGCMCDEDPHSSSLGDLRVQGDGSRCSSVIDTPNKGLVNDDLEGPGKDYSTDQMNSLMSKVRFCDFPQMETELKATSSQ